MKEKKEGRRFHRRGTEEEEQSEEREDEERRKAIMKHTWGWQALSDGSTCRISLLHR